jgi:N utilization substance protein A
MASLSTVGEDLAETLFKLGWRSVVDLADGVPEELAAVPGLGGLEAARRISQSARQWLDEEAGRQKRLREEAQRRASLSDEQRLLEVKGMAPELVAQLVQAGYRTVDALAREEDLERLSQIGIPAGRAANLRHYARIYLGEIPEGTPPPSAGGPNESVDQKWT